MYDVVVKKSTIAISSPDEFLSDTDVSQGSEVTRLRCGRIINVDFVAYSLVNLPVNKF